MSRPLRPSDVNRPRSPTNKAARSDTDAAREAGNEEDRSSRPLAALGLLLVLVAAAALVLPGRGASRPLAGPTSTPQPTTSPTAEPEPTPTPTTAEVDRERQAFAALALFAAQEAAVSSLTSVPDVLAAPGDAQRRAQDAERSVHIALMTLQRDDRLPQSLQGYVEHPDQDVFDGRLRELASETALLQSVELVHQEFRQSTDASNPFALRLLDDVTRSGNPTLARWARALLAEAAGRRPAEDANAAREAAGAAWTDQVATLETVSVVRLKLFVATLPSELVSSLRLDTTAGPALVRLDLIPLGSTLVPAPASARSD